MNNEPKVEIEYLVNYDLEFSGNSALNEKSDASSLNDIDARLVGKKGLHLCGGGVDASGEVYGCVLDGTYTFYESAKKSYKGIMGDCLSGEDYGFAEPQYIDIGTKYDNTYIKSLVVYFDGVAKEYATQISFSNGVNADGTANPLYNGATKIKNNRLVFMYNFGENSTLKSVRMNIERWSKKVALVKVLKIVTGYTGIYTPATLNSLSYSDNKFADEEQLRFGVSLQSADLQVIDKNGEIKVLYDNGLFYKNIKVNIYIDDILDGTYRMDVKKGTTQSLWDFDLKDALSFRLEDKLTVINVSVGENGLPIARSLNWFIRYAVGTSFNIIYDEGLEAELDQIMIPIPFVKPGQTRYDLLLKCCQVGLLRMYSDKYENLIISRGL